MGQRIRLWQERLALLGLLTCVLGCVNIRRREDVAQAIGSITSAQLEQHVLALAAIGPRSVGSPAETRETLNYLTRELRAYGYEVQEELFEIQLTSRVVATVVPKDSPEATPIELELAPDLTLGGRLSMVAQSARLRQEGWEVQGYTLQGMQSPQTISLANLIAILPSAKPPAHIVELSAHYDTVAGSPGADDNASGVAALLEVARICASVTTEKGIRFCFFGAEEAGKLGSAAHLQAILEDRSSQVEGLINLDGVGFTAQSQTEPDDVPWFLSLPKQGNFIIVIGKWSSGWLGNLFEGAIDAYTPELPYYSANRIGAFFQDADRSDHANYWSAGIPAIMISDTGEFRGTNYHTERDTPDQLDYVFLTHVARASAAAALHWAGLP